MNNRYQTSFDKVPLLKCSIAIGHLSHSLMWCDTYDEQIMKRDHELLEAVYTDVCLLLFDSPELDTGALLDDEQLQSELNDEERQHLEDLYELNLGIESIARLLKEGVTMPPLAEYDTLQLITAQRAAQWRIKKVVKQLALETSKHEPKPPNQE